jgi:ATP-dependent RNA helicase DeaD
VKIRLGCGKSDGIRPGDLVGAIANEARVDAGEIGAIEIAQHYSIVEIASDVVDRVVTALARSKIKGKRVGVKRDAAK